MTKADDSRGERSRPVDLRPLGDWTSWSSLLVLLLLVPLTGLCLAPFVFVVSGVLPGSFDLWMILYFAALPLALVPGLEFLQVRLVCPDSRKPMPDESARLLPLWDRVLARVGKGKRRRYRLRVADDHRINAAAGGGSLVIVTTHALNELPDRQLEAVLAHEFGHHVGLHPIVLMAQQWLAWPLDWASRLSVAVHKLLAWLTRWPMPLLLRVLVWTVVLLIRLALLALDAIVKIAALVLLFLGRHAEYHADAVATELGYGGELVEALSKMENHDAMDRSLEPVPVPVSPLWDTHPPTSKRLNRIRNLMATT